MGDAEGGREWTHPGVGVTNIGDNNFAVTRFLNSAQLIEEVTRYARTPEGLRNVVRYQVDGGQTEMVDWYAHARGSDGDPHQVICALTSGGWAVNCFPGNISYVQALLYDSSPAIRAGTIVHEATHDDVDHIRDRSCLRGASCDLYFGEHNANTMQILFWFGAARAHRLDSRGVPMLQSRTLPNGDRSCSVVPLVSNDESDIILNAAGNVAMNGFGSRRYPAGFEIGMADQIRAQRSQTWDCSACRQADDTWDDVPSQRGASACNETLNPRNATINAANRSLCNSLAAVPVTDVAAQRTSFQAQRQACERPIMSRVRAYCERRVNSFATLATLDDYGFLASAGYLDDCTRRFCQARFEPAWANEDAIRYNDRYGCANAICGDINSPQADIRERAALCRQGFFRQNGDPSRYIAQGEVNHCKELRNQCEYGRWDPSTPFSNSVFPFGDRITCMEEADRCEDLRLASLTALSRELLVPQRRPLPLPIPLQNFVREGLKDYHEILGPIKKLDLKPQDIKRYPEILAVFSESEFHAQAHRLAPEIYQTLLNENALGGKPESVSLDTLKRLTEATNAVQKIESFKGAQWKDKKARKLFVKAHSERYEKSRIHPKSSNRMPANVPRK